MKTVLQEGRGMAHQFKIGQLVRMKARFPGGTGYGMYEVVRLVPPDIDGVPCYRIKDSTGVRTRCTRDRD